MNNPAFFQGRNRRKRYFEGWYFKCISADRKHAIAIIPGMAVNRGGQKHAFIQVINAVSGKTWYHPFPYEQFESPNDQFEVHIGENRFDSAGLKLAIDRPEGQLHGNLTFANIRPFPVSRHNPGIMGPFSFVPFMECYHAIVDLYHDLRGVLVLDGETLDFDGGVGYIEKDYGRSFPKTYLWLQASHFHVGDASFVFSRARIPWLGREFPGFFAYLTDFKDVQVRFATYNRSKLRQWTVDPTRGTCSGELVGPAGVLSFQAQMQGGGRLRAPVDGQMDREIIESITASVSVKLVDPQGRLVFDSTSTEAGMEISL